MPDLPKNVFSSETGSFTPFFSADVSPETILLQAATDPVYYYQPRPFSRQVAVNKGCNIGFAVDITTGLYYFDPITGNTYQQFTWNGGDQGWNITSMNLVFSVRNNPVITLPLVVEAIGYSSSLNPECLAPMGSAPLNLNQGTNTRPFAAPGVNYGGFFYSRLCGVNSQTSFETQTNILPERCVSFSYPSAYINGSSSSTGVYSGTEVYSVRALHQVAFEFDTLTMNGVVVQSNFDQSLNGFPWALGIGLIAMSI